MAASCVGIATGFVLLTSASLSIDLSAFKMLEIFFRVTLVVARRAISAVLFEPLTRALFALNNLRRCQRGVQGLECCSSSLLIVAGRAR